MGDHTLLNKLRQINRSFRDRPSPLTNSNQAQNKFRDNLRRVSRKYTRGRRVSPQELKHMRADLLDEATLDLEYVVLTIGACAIATFGLLSNSAAVIIGAMIIAPLMLPIRGIAFGALEADVELVRRGLISVVAGTLLAATLACLIGLIVNLPGYGDEILARSKPTLLDLGIAVVAGGISGFAKVQPKLSSTLAGTAIAVALMPPVCVIGLGWAHMDRILSEGAALLYLTNLLGITLACMLAFLIKGYTPLARARHALGLTLAFTSVLLIPLGINLVELVRQNQLESSLKQALLRGTVTFQRVRLVASETDWLIDPPEVRLIVRTQEPVTPKQVQLLEEFVENRMGQQFTLIFEISSLQEVTREEIETTGAEMTSEITSRQN
ncbi:MAG: DUF389 domain-containing protein [Cyanothece sp. SIO1E1]|nr:DUF389 domain-containing protein [Cyanothece sp. SIO1E1]